MENNIQDLIDQQNAQKVKDHAKAERKKKVDSFFAKVRNRIEKRKAKREAIRKAKEEKAAELAQEKQKKQEYQDACNKKYQAYLKMNENPNLDGQKTIDESGNATHIVQSDAGYIVSTSYNPKNFPQHCLNIHSFEGFSTTLVNGVEQKVYVSLKMEYYEGYECGLHYEQYSDEARYYTGFMRNIKGEFEEISVYDTETPKEHIELYRNIATSYLQHAEQTTSVDQSI